MQKKQLNKNRMLYKSDPDFTKPLLELPDDVREKLRNRLVFLYGGKEADKWMPELERILKVHYAYKPEEMIEAEKSFDPAERFTEKDMILITYGDLVQGKEISPLATLHRFVEMHIRGAINTVHILPFFPYSSDRGFAIIDFKSVDPKLGSWDDILEIGSDYDLMFDGVLNHCSSRSLMFSEFIKGNPNFKNHFIAYDSPDDLTSDQRSKIFRPRTSDILSEFHTVEGPKYVWTTFSKDQVDFNFRNPAVLMSVLEGLLLYARNGADIIRLDAVTFIWAEPGTECIHLPQTHEIVKFMRDVMDAVEPCVALITETNVPHEDNISYFGNGRDEAHMVYNFALPPLILHTFYTGNTTAISKWAKDLKTDSDYATFFNIMDTHDGIGVMGVKELLSKQEIDFIIQTAKSHGAIISNKMTENMTEEPYEINTTWWNAINPENSDEDITLQAKRFVASRSIALMLRGVPGLYTHGVMGTSNNHDLANRTGIRRDVNRGFIDIRKIAKDLKDPSSKTALIREKGSRLHLLRTGSRAFHPRGEQKILTISKKVFTVLRISPEKNHRVLTMTNVTDDTCDVTIPLSDLGALDTKWYDVVNGQEFDARGKQINVSLQPYDIVWLVPFNELTMNYKWGRAELALS